jgi:cytochrome P450
VLTPAFGAGYVREIVPIFTEKANHLVDVLTAQLNSQKAEGIEVFGLLSRCTLDIIGSAGQVLFWLTAHTVGFGYEFNTLETPNDAFAKAYTILLQQIDISIKFNIATFYLPFLLKLPFPRVLEASAARNLIIEYARSLVQDKEGTRRSGKDILSLMIAENEKAAGTLAEKELVDQCLTFLLAGHETISTAVILFSETHS